MFVELSFNPQNAATIYILDMMGNVKHQTSSKDALTTFSSVPLNPGTYLVKVLADNEYYISPLILK